jgi:hypothetical protein
MIADAYITNQLRVQGSTLSERISEDLKAFYDVRDPDLVQGAMTKIMTDSRVYIAPNAFRYNTFILKYKREE